MDLREYLVGRGLLHEDEKDVRATAKQVLDYLKCQEGGAVNLSAVTVTERLSIVGMTFEGFNAMNCDFNGGLEIRNCKFVDDVTIITGYVQRIFLLENVEIGGDLDMPQNISELMKEEIEISNLYVKGKIVIDQL